MIVTELYDGQGFGNQLWCYVVTRVIAKNSGYKFGIKSPEKFKGGDFMQVDFGQKVIGGTGPEGGPPRTLPEGIKYYYNERKINHPENGVDIRMYDKNLVTVPDQTKIDGIMQDEQYIISHKDEIREWLKVRPEDECTDFSSDDICVINFRGGEYVGIKDVFLPQKYWEDAIGQMLKINKNFRFVVITDDVITAKKFFPDFDVFHFSLSKDYVVIKNAHYLILSNSSFAWFPSWLNQKVKMCIAPKYWSQYNTSDGFWGCSYNLTSGWLYLDRDGKLSNYDVCLKEFKAYVETHQSYYQRPKLKNNYLVVSNYYNDISWVPDYTDNYIVYDQSDAAIYPPKLDLKKVIKSPHLGHNIRDYCTFIIDHYDSLPERTLFATGNIFPRHVSREFFDKIMNNKFFTPIEDYKRHEEKWPLCFFSSDGGYNEVSNSWYLNENHPTKYFHSYNDFLRFCFKDPLIPRYIRFAPGANYIVPREQILKLPKVFYENLRTFVSHCETAIPGESHIIERALYTLWTSNFDINEQMLKPVGKDFIALPRSKEEETLSLKDKIVKKGRGLVQAFSKKKVPVVASSAVANLSEYRQKIKLYDVFTFFNELDLLEIRLNILDPYVDYFVIVEATETFSGQPKPLYYQQNKARFKKFQHKIIHHITKDTPRDYADLKERLTNHELGQLDREIINLALTSDNVPEGQIHWLKEFYQKESIRKALVNLGDNDICFIGDVDEIWNPAAKIDFTRDDIFKLRQIVYAYYFNNRSSESWAGTLVTKYKNIKDACLNHLRTASKTRYTYIKNGGWHFTNQGGPNQIRKKLESYGHQEFNTESIKADLENRIDQNTDFIGRNFTFWLDERDLPEYIKKNHSKYKAFFSKKSETK